MGGAAEKGVLVRGLSLGVLRIPTALPTASRAARTAKGKVSDSNGAIVAKEGTPLVGRRISHRDSAQVVPFRDGITATGCRVGVQEAGRKRCLSSTKVRTALQRTT